MATIEQLTRCRYSSARQDLLKDNAFYEHNNKLFFTEKRDGEVGFNFEVEDILFYGASQYQDALVLKTKEEGNLLVLDAMTMISDNSERWYHEFMAHVPLFLHQSLYPRSQNVLILGGGDGGIVRETLKHSSVHKIVQCDIDELVTRLTEKYFPQLTTGINDSKVELIFDDAKKFLNTSTDKFDIVFYDLCDPNVGPTEGMFADEIFQKTYGLMNPGGMLVMQSESPIRNKQWLEEMQNVLKDQFVIVAPYQYPMPIYPGGIWSALLCIKEHPNDNLKDPSDVFISLQQQKDISLHHYNARTHKAGFLSMNSYFENGKRVEYRGL